MTTPHHPHWLDGPARPGFHVAVVIIRRTAVTLYVPIVLLGMLASPLKTTLVEGPVAAILLVTSGVTGYRMLVERWPAAHQVRVGGYLAFGLPLYFAGASALGALGSAVTLTLLVLCAAHMVLWVRTEEFAAGVTPSTPAAMDPTSGTGDDDTLRALLGTMSLEVLFDEWHATEEDDNLLPESRDLGARRRLRELIVDELRRRDPAGVDRWLARGGVDPPENHITDDPPLER